MGIRLKLTLLLMTLFIATIFNSVFTFRLESFGEEKLKWVNHTHEVLIETEKFLSSMKDTETGQRGYLLTQNPAYLEPYHTGSLAAKDSLKILLLLTLDSPVQQKILQSIATLMQKKLTELGKTIEFAQFGDHQKALTTERDNLGKGFMDEIRSKLRTFTNNELVLLEKRKGDFRENRAEITTLIAVEMAFFIGLAIATLTFLRKSFFLPLTLLLKSAKKMESGNKLDATDIVEKNEMGHLLSTFFEMSEKVYERAQLLDHKIQHDELTGLRNRMVLSEEIENSIADLSTTQSKLAVLFLDLNSFKQINDTLGHDVGDIILQETANRLNASVRSSDMVFRVGGDEFVIIARHIRNNRDVQSLMDNIINAFKEPAMVRGEAIEISISVGATIAPDDTDEAEQLIQFADVAMYEAKRDSSTDIKIFNKSMLRRASDHRSDNAGD